MSETQQQTQASLPNLSLNFFNNYVTTGVSKDGSTLVENPKKISYSDSVPILESALEFARNGRIGNMEEQSDEPRVGRVTTPLQLPTNTVAVHEVKEGGKTVGLNLNMYHPGRPDVSIRYGSSSHRIPFPNIIIAIKLLFSDKTNLHSISDNVRFFATNKPRSMVDFSSFIYNTSWENRIWSLPLPNMYDNGNMCLGDNTTIPPNYENGNFTGMDWTYELIESSGFNSDLNIRGTKESWGCGEWIRELKKYKGKEFPYYLLRSHPARSFDDQLELAKAMKF